MKVTDNFTLLKVKFLPIVAKGGISNKNATLLNTIIFLFHTGTILILLCKLVRFCAHSEAETVCLLR